MQTSVAAVIAFVLGLLAVLAVPFSLMLALCLGLAAVAPGQPRSSGWPGPAGRRRRRAARLASALVLALATLALVGLRYIGIDTAFGDPVLPTLADWLAALNTLLPAP